MKSFSVTLLLFAAFISTVMGVSVVVKNDEVYVDDKKIDLTKLQVIKDNDLYTTYELKSGQSVITITKSKVGNALTVSSKGPMTEAEKKKMEEMQTKIKDDVGKEIKKVHEGIVSFNKKLDEDIKRMNSEISNMFKFPAFPMFPLFD